MQSSLVYLRHTSECKLVSTNHSIKLIKISGNNQVGVGW